MMKKYNAVLEELSKLELDETIFADNEQEPHQQKRKNEKSEKLQSLPKNKNTLLNNIFNCISDGISVLNDNFEIIMVNKTIKNLYKDKLPLSDKKCYTVYQNRNSICPWCPSIKAMEKKSKNSTIVPYPDENNPQGWLSLTCFPLVNSQDEVYGVIEQVRDITEHKKMEDRFRMISEVTTDLIYEWDIKKDTLEWFGDIDQVLGYEPDEVDKTIEGWVKLIHPDDLKRLSNSVERHRTEIKPIEEIYRVRKKDGTWVYWEDRGKPILDTNGKPVKWIGGCKDISKQKEMEQELKHQIEKLERYKKVTIGRELRIKELKQRIRQLQGELV